MLCSSSRKSLQAAVAVAHRSRWLLLLSRNATKKHRRANATAAVPVRLLSTTTASGDGGGEHPQQKEDVDEQDVGSPKKKNKWRSVTRGEEESSSESYWVPAAYHASSGRRKQSRRMLPNLSSTSRGRTLQDEQPNVDNLKHERQLRLVVNYKEIAWAAPKYRNAFTKVPTAPTGSFASMGASTSSSSGLLDPGFGARMQNQIATQLQDIHKIDDGVVVDWNKILDTEKDFILLCRSLQHMCATCTTLGRYDSTDIRTAPDDDHHHDHPSTVPQNQHQEQYLDLAEFLLLALVQLGQDRAELVESVLEKEKQEAKAAAASVKETPPPTTSIEETQKPKQQQQQQQQDTKTVLGEKTSPPAESSGGIMGWFSSIVETVTPIIAPFYEVKSKEEEKPASAVDDQVKADKVDTDVKAEVQKEEKPAATEPTTTTETRNVGSLAHEAPYLESTQRLFRLVVASIANNAKHVEPDEQDKADDEKRASETTKSAAADDVPSLSSSTNEERNGARRKACEQAAHRMLKLMHRMPRKWPNPDPVTIRFMMETLCRAGSLDSARTCNRLYYETTPQGLKYSLVPEAYLEAVKFESDEKTRRVIVTEAIQVLHQFFSSKLPANHVERIMHCSNVLNCISTAGLAHDFARINDAENLVKRAIGKDRYDALFETDLKSDNPKIDMPALPMVNFLVQIYAASRDQKKVEISKRLLKYMLLGISKDRNGFAYTFPSTDACNAVLHALPDRYRLSRGPSFVSEAIAKADLDYAMDLMDFLCGKSDETIPATTHELMFRLLDAANPDDAGDVAEDVLSKMEIAGILQEKTSSITLSTYHRILGYWLKMAKSGRPQTSGRGSPCERALSILDKLEVQSTPMIISDKALTFIEGQNLYDVSLRPQRRTYALVLTICSETANPGDKAGAFDVAAEVYRRMKQKGFSSGDDITELLTKICNFLPIDSSKRKELEASIQSEGRENDVILKSA